MALMMAHLMWYLDPLSLHQLKKKKKKGQIWTPLAKLSGLAHERLSEDEVVVDKDIQGSSADKKQTLCPAPPTLSSSVGLQAFIV